MCTYKNIPSLVEDQLTSVLFSVSHFTQFSLKTTKSTYFKCSFFLVHFLVIRHYCKDKQVNQNKKVKTSETMRIIFTHSHNDILGHRAHDE